MDANQVISVLLNLLTLILLAYVGNSSRKNAEDRQENNRKFDKINNDFWQLRENFKKDVEQLSKEFHSSAPGVMRAELSRLTTDHATMHRWKNEILPLKLEKMEGQIYDRINDAKKDTDRRLDRIEVKVFNGLR